MLTDDQIRNFDENGYLLLSNIFLTTEITRLKEEMNFVLQEETPKKILEKNGDVRSFFAPHEKNEIFDLVTKSSRIVNPVMDLLQSKVYIHQTKINSKNAMTGDWWEWHQDFPYWQLEDGMPSPRVLTAMIFLDEVTEFNGPMILVPGSHKAGVVDSDPNENKLESESEWFQSYQKSTSYMSNLTAKLKYTLKKETLAKWIDRNGIFSAKGPAGSVLLFNGLVFHASSNNLSPWHRHTYLITYNSIDNTLLNIKAPRPGFLANQDFTPVTSLEGEILIKKTRRRLTTYDRFK